MEKRLTTDALLRHLLDAEKGVPDEKTIYSYLLGYRLFQSPNQLLCEIQKRIGTTKDSAEVRQRFQRQNCNVNHRSKAIMCTKCKQSHESARNISKSTNNMLERDSSVYVQLIHNNVIMNEAGRKNIQNNLVECGAQMSPVTSAEEVNRRSAVNESDFDDYCDISDPVFEENRRNTAPPSSLNKMTKPMTCLSPLAAPTKDVKSRGTDFRAESETIFSSTLENLPETTLDDYQCADGVVASGEDTIRRRRKGRRRTAAPSPDTELLSEDGKISEPVAFLKPEKMSLLNERHSVASRDSGILSGVTDFEIDEDYNHPHNNNNNNKKVKTVASSNQQTKEKSSSSAGSPEVKPRRVTSTLYKNLAASPHTSTSDDSGNVSQITEPSVVETLQEVSKEVEAHICTHLQENPETNDACARQRHLLYVLLVWVRDFPSDFRNKKMMLSLNGLIESLQNDCHELKEHCAKVLETLSQCSAAQKKYEQRLLDFNHKDAAKRSEDFRKTKEAMVSMVTGLSYVSDAKKVAEQLCLIEMDLLRHLGAEEFLQMFNSSSEDDSKTNLGACVRWFNHLSHLVATTVCLCRKPKHRRHVISLFARTAARCHQLSNFNSAMAILTGLSLGAVARLTRTWNKVDCEQIEKLQTVFDPSNNFRRYRTVFNSRWAALRNHQEEEVQQLVPSNHNENRYSSASITSRLSVVSTTSQHRDSGIECENDSATSSKSSSSASSPKKKFTFDDVTSLTGIQDGVLVPFLTLMVKDVYFLNHSTPTVEQDGTINFEKLRHLGEILRPLETWKQNPCVYEANQDLQEFLLHSPVLKDSELYNLSYKREPPKNKFEKTQLKTIKAELETKKRSDVISRIISRRKTM